MKFVDRGEIGDGSVVDINAQGLQAMQDFFLEAVLAVVLLNFRFGIHRDRRLRNLMGKAEKLSLVGSEKSRCEHSMSEPRARSHLIGSSSLGKR